MRVLLLTLCLKPEAKALPLSVWRNREPGHGWWDANRAAALEGGLAVPQVGKQKVTRRPSKSAPRSTPRRNGRMSDKTCTLVLGSILRNSQGENGQMS